MKIRITENTVAAGKVAQIDEVLELPEKEALFLVAIKKAVKVVDETPQPAAAQQIETADAEPQIETAAKPRAKRKEN